MAHWDCHSIAQAFANAAIDASKWDAALDVVTTETESSGALLLPVTGDLIRNIPFTDRMSRSVEVYFQDGWHLRDERLRGFDRLVAHGVVDDLDIFTTEQISRLPYYQEFLAPRNLRWFAGVKVASGSDLWCLSIQRTIAQGPFSGEEKQKLARLSKSLSSSAALARTLGSATEQGALEAFDATGTAVILINSHGDVFRVNAAAERMLKGDVKIARRKLLSKDPRANAELEQALQNLLRRPVGAAFADLVCLPRSERSPLLAHPIRLPGLTANILADCQAVVILIDPESRVRPPEVLLRTAFRLTTAEARLASRLASGETLEVATEQLSIASETGRNHLKSVFAKVGVHRQAELVAALAPFLQSRER